VKNLYFIALVLLCLVQPAYAQRDQYVRVGAGVGYTSDTVFFDKDCASTNPASLFGCGSGPDGLQRGGYGDFGKTPFFELSYGFRKTDWLRVELSASILTDAAFKGQSNFTGIPISHAPIRADLSNTMIAANGYFELLPLFGYQNDLQLSPYLVLGVGVSQNKVGKMTYEFPSLGPTAATIVPSGSNTDLSLGVGFGIDIELTGRTFLDIGYRYWDRGSVETKSGNILIVRSGANDLSIPIGETEAKLKLHHANIALRYLF